MIPGRLVLSLAALALLQDVPATRQIDLTITQGTSMAAAASPDQRSIAIDLLGGIWILPIRGGEAKRITPELLEARQPTWSPDSQSIAFQGYDDGTWHIYVIPRDGGEAKAITSGLFDDREPAWSHDGSRIAFSSGSLRRHHHDLDRRRRHRRGAADQHARRLDAGLVAQRSGGDVRLGRRRRARAARRVAGAVGRERGRRERRIVTNVKDEGIPSAAAWDPAGRTLAYVAGSHLYAGAHLVAALDVFPVQAAMALVERDPLHGKRTHLAAGIAVAKRHARWTARRPQRVPFTAKVSLQRSTYTIAHRALEPAEPQKVTGIVSPVVSPDGRAIAFTAMGDLWVLPAGGQPVQITNDAAVEIDPAWSPDSAQLAFASDRGGHMDLWVRDLRDNRSTQLTEERGAVSGPAWSPDGNHIAFLLDHRELGTVDLQRDTHHFAFTASTPGELGRPTWSADSNSIAVGSLFSYSSRYREGLNQILLYSSNTSGALVVGPLSRALGRQPAGHRPGVVAGRLPHGVRQRRRAVGRAGGRARRRDRTAAAGRRPINRSRRAGKATRSTSSTRRRAACGGSSPTAACPSRFRSISPGATVRRPADRRARRTRRRRRARGGARRGRHRDRIGRHQEHRRASRRAAHRRGRRRVERVRDARADRDARASRRWLRSRISGGCGWRTGSPACGFRRSTRTPGSSSARRSTPAAGRARACSSPAIRSTARASTTRAACR